MKMDMLIIDMESAKSNVNNWKKNICFLLGEVPVKWMDQPSATKMERGRASEMAGRKSAQKK